MNPDAIMQDIRRTFAQQARRDFAPPSLEAALTRLAGLSARIACRGRDIADGDDAAAIRVVLAAMQGRGE